MYTYGIRPLPTVIYITKSMVDLLNVKDLTLEDALNFNKVVKSMGTDYLLSFAMLNLASPKTQETGLVYYDKHDGIPYMPMSLGDDGIFALWRKSIKENEDISLASKLEDIVTSAGLSSARQSALKNLINTEEVSVEENNLPSILDYSIQDTDNYIFVISDKLNLIENSFTSQWKQIVNKIIKDISKCFCNRLNPYDVAKTNWFYNYIRTL